ncbi:GMC family oxidoreductase [Aestuariivirga sp. YIM B02566]|uniref:GMC family oxidoreductase N-terminal domain-containing protein n=1 Tax=Taklimakanibacter albus TaxID=2800327 RepID=A0ACC5QZN7_9HYPH|nr:GMC family oxidoreductase N-terminal domain-containing protein [Aestuariivirga sp. YIM B02566]MBK1865772.1 GMC family oxidoreductase N-terminal domain-containing protein [Aestuariivirga sp. YIM B02566]
MSAGEVDYIIVGGGSSGCIVAARLSENPAVKVILLEAGMDAVRPEDFPDLASSYPGIAYSNPRYTWKDLKASGPYQGSNQPEARAKRYEQARLLGGGSAINGIGANRGSPHDYDEWRDLGVEGWSFAECLPYFKKLERDLDIDDELHGKTGPFPIRRRGAEIWTPFTHAMLALCAERGIPFLPDQNGKWEDGIFEMAVNMDEQKRRVSTAWAYLTPEVRRRPNLEIRTETTVSRLLISEGRAKGVIARRGNVQEKLAAHRVVVCAGALATPAILMRSGVGPAPHLGDCGIETVQDLPGVGQNLMEHPSSGLVPFLKPSARQKGPLDYHIPIGYRFSSGVEGCAPGDMHMNFVTRAAWHSVGGQLGALFFWVNKSYSKGQLLLDPAAPDGPPRIDFRLLSDRRDLVRLADAFERAVSLGTDPRLSSVVSGLYAGGMSEFGKLFSTQSRLGAVVTGIGALGLDMIGKYRDKAFPHMLSNFNDPKRLAGNRAELEAYISETVGGVWHPTCTCRMGPESDKLAVTDARGKVRKLDGLYISDASIMPTIPCANTNLPTIMMAEKIADGLKRG